MSNLPVSMTALHQGNEFKGLFRLEFMGELIADIPFDALSFKMPSSLEILVWWMPSMCQEAWQMSRVDSHGRLNMEGICLQQRCTGMVQANVGQKLL